MRNTRGTYYMGMISRMNYIRGARAICSINMLFSIRLRRVEMILLLCKSRRAISMPRQCAASRSKISPVTTRPNERATMTYALASLK